MDAATATSEPAAHNVVWGYCRISGNFESILRCLIIFPFFLFSALSSFSRFPPFLYHLAPAPVFFFLLFQTPPSDQSSPLACSGSLTSAAAFVTFLTIPSPYQRAFEQLTDFPLLQMVGQQQLQRSPFSVGPGQNIQHNNILSQFQNNAAISQMTAPQLQAAFQQNRATPAMLANLQPTQTRQLELMMAQHQSPHNNQVNGLIASRLNPSQPIQQGFPQGMIGGTPNSGQLSQGKFLCRYDQDISSHATLVSPATPVQMFNGATSQDTKRAALQELRNRAMHLHANIKNVEQQQATFASQRSIMGEAMLLQKMAIAEQDIARKRAILTKWNMMLSANGMPPIGQGV